MTTNNNEVLIYERYRIIEELSRGGFGITYLAADKLLDNLLCVVKKLEPQKADVETAKKLFQREATVLAYLKQNPQIPKYLNYFEDDTSYYLVEEYIQGKTLDKLSENNWTEQETVNFLEEMLSVLQYLHEKNIIHRDIKPSNLIKRELDKKFVLIDFGAVKKIDVQYLISEQNPIQTIIYTQGYGSPEQMEGKPRLNSDIYSLGMTAIQLLTGIAPRELIRNGTDEVILEGVGQPLASILVKMVYRDYAMRYQSAEEVIADLEQISTDIPITRVSSQSRNQPYNIDSQYSESQRQLLLFSNKKYRSIFLGFIFFIILFIGIELVNPWIRPWYYLSQGNRLLDEDKLTPAFQAFEDLKNLKPDSAQASKGQGDVRFKQGRYNQALAHYERASLLQPDYIKALMNKGRILYLMGRYEESLNVYTKVLTLKPNNPSALSGQGIAYMGKGQFEKASESFRQVRILQPEDPRIWRDIGFTVERLQGKQAAKEYFETALRSYDDFLKRNPNKVIYWTDKGSVLLKLNDPENALESFNKALEINNNFFEALMGKANTQSQLRKYQDALATFEQAAEVRPKNYLVWYNRGRILLHIIKDYNLALESFEKSIRQRNNFHPAWVGKGIALLELERYNDALDAFDQAKRIAPTDPLVWANRGYALRKLGRIKESQESYEEAVRLGFPREQINDDI